MICALAAPATGVLGAGTHLLVRWSAWKGMSMGTLELIADHGAVGRVDRLRRLLEFLLVGWFISGVALVGATILQPGGPILRDAADGRVVDVSAQLPALLLVAPVICGLVAAALIVVVRRPLPTFLLLASLGAGSLIWQLPRQVRSGDEAMWLAVQLVALLGPVIGMAAMGLARPAGSVMTADGSA